MESETEKKRRQTAHDKRADALKKYTAAIDEHEQRLIKRIKEKIEAVIYK